MKAEDASIPCTGLISRSQTRITTLLGVPQNYLKNLRFYGQTDLARRSWMFGRRAGRVGHINLMGITQILIWRSACMADACRIKLTHPYQIQMRQRLLLTMH
jgi:hypothetical protein